MTAPMRGDSGREVFTLDRGFRRPLVQRGALAPALTLVHPASRAQTRAASS